MNGKVDARAIWILAALAITEGSWVLFNAVANGRGFWQYLGFAEGRMGFAVAWGLAVLFVFVYGLSASRLPSVRSELLRPSWLKALSLVAAFAAGILEEVIFRKWVMDYMRNDGQGWFLQVLASAVAFGAVHAIWGLFGGSMRAAGSAAVATGLMGAALAIIYLSAGRSLAPCIAAHVLINALVEPGLVLAAIRGEMADLRAPDSGDRAAR